MKKIIRYIFSFVMIVFILGQSVNVYETTTYAKPKVSLPKAPDIVGESAILIEPDTGTILYQKDPNSKRYPASITKIMTCLLTLEHCQMDEEVVYSKKNIKSLTLEDSNIECKIGEKMKVKDCLYALMLSSANETATALAEHISGSTEAFSDLMNQRAKEIGVTGTHFANANGLHDDNHFVTASDMAKIMAEAIKYPKFLDVIHSTTYTIPANNKRKEPYQSIQRNMMLFPTSQYYDEDVIGGKTGYTDQAGKCLVSYAKRGNVFLICVVLKSEGDTVFVDTKKLFDYGFSNFSYVNASENDTRFQTNSMDYLSSPFSENTKTITIDKDASILVPKGVSITDLDTEVSFKLTDDSFATITYKYGDNVMGTAKIKYIDSGSTVEEKITTKTEAVNKGTEKATVNSAIANHTDKKSGNQADTTKNAENKTDTAKEQKQGNSFHLLTILVPVLLVIIIAVVVTIFILQRRKLNRIRAMKRKRNR